MQKSPTAHYKYVYDGQGNIVRSIDILARKEYNYLYEDGKIMQSTESVIVLDECTNMVISKTAVCTVRYYYDNEDGLVKKHIKFADGKELTENYEKTENDSQVVKFTAGGKTVISHSKNDSFGRKVFDELQLSTGFVSRQFTYLAGEVTDKHTQNNMLKSSPTTQLVSQIVLSGGRTISYEYDEEERITKVDDSIDGVTEYTYDALGQLVSETKDNQTVVNSMTYDNYGNIKTKNGVVYDYDEVWKDKLISYNGQEIVYDEQGNPVNYLGHTLTWEKGRQLKRFVKDDGTVIDYTYNANGIRTSKTVDGIRHDYVLDGAKILRETWCNNTLVPLYDNEDSVCGIEFNGTAYYFLKNLQGDIIAITDNSGEEVARYTYDAWGVCTVTQDISNCDIANINPFRYRGYFYDLGTDLYYLQSRYYDAQVGRFVNGDMVEIVATDSKPLVPNLYCYCENNILNAIDPSGYIKLEIHVQVPSVGSTVVWAYKNGDFSAGHVYVVLDPEGNKTLNKGKKIARGFRPKTDRTAWVAIGRVSVKGLIEEQNKLRYDSRVCYSITEKQFAKVRNFLYNTKPPKYNIVSYNCTTFAIDALNKAGIKHKFKKHFWNIGLPAYLLSAALFVSSARSAHNAIVRSYDPIVSGFSCLMSITKFAAATFLFSFSLSYGYTPSRLAYDINKGIR